LLSISKYMNSWLHDFWILLLKQKIFQIIFLWETFPFIVHRLIIIIIDHKASIFKKKFGEKENLFVNFFWMLYFRLSQKRVIYRIFITLFAKYIHIIEFEFDKDFSIRKTLWLLILKEKHMKKYRKEKIENRTKKYSSNKNITPSSNRTHKFHVIWDRQM
jgi:hypothetical protein